MECNVDWSSRGVTKDGITSEYAMKLTEIMVDNYRNLRNLRLSNLSSGLNVVYGERGTGKSDLAEYVRGLVLGSDVPNQSQPVNYQTVPNHHVDSQLFDNVFNFVGRSDPQTIRDLSMTCLLYTSPSPRDATLSRMPSSA